MLLSGCPASFPCDLCWRCNACVWVCKLRTALEATWACGCVCVSVYQHTHTHLSNKNDLNRTRWKCFLPAYEYVRKYTQQASCTGNCEPQRRRETRTHAQRKVNLHTSCHSKPAQQPEHQTLPHAKCEPTQRKLKSCSNSTHWLVRGCCIHWEAVPAGLEATGSPTCGGRSRSRWARGSRWGGGPAPGCPSQPWWLSPPTSHEKTSLG